MPALPVTTGNPLKPALLQVIIYTLMDREGSRKRRKSPLLKPKRRFSPSFLHSKDQIPCICELPKHRTRKSALSVLLGSIDSSPLPRASNLRSSRGKSTHREWKEAQEKPFIGVGFGDLGPVSDKQARIVPLHMRRYMQESQCDSQASLLSYQSPQFSFEHYNSILRSYTRQASRPIKSAQYAANSSSFRRLSRDISARSTQPESVDRVEVEAGAGPVIVIRPEKPESQGGRRVIMEKRSIRPATAYADSANSGLYIHYSERKLSLFQNDSLQQLTKPSL